MAKIRITKKEAMRRFKCFEVLNGKLDIALRKAEPAFYTAGYLGHNADIYVFGNYAIVTGERPFGIKVPREMVDTIESAARTLHNIARTDGVGTGDEDDDFFKQFSDYVESGRFEKLVKGE